MRCWKVKKKKNGTTFRRCTTFNKLPSVLTVSLLVLMSFYFDTKFGCVHHMFCLLHRLLQWGWQASQSSQFQLHVAKEGDQHGAWYGQMEKITGMLLNPLKSSLSATLRDEKKCSLSVFFLSIFISQSLKIIIAISIVWHTFLWCG